MKKIITATFFIAMFSASVANAGPAWEFSTSGQSFSNGSWNFSNNFIANSNVSVTGLGYYADPNSGIVGNNVALFDSSGTLLASAYVDNTNPLFGHFGYVTIAPVNLIAGNTYQIAGVSNSTNYTWDNPGFATDPSITYLSNQYLSAISSTPVFVNSSNQTGVNDVSNGYFGPNLFLGAPTFASVPEPAILSIFAFSSLFGAIGLKRKPKFVVHHI